MYGVESAVHPAYQGAGIGRRLMKARMNVLKGLNLRGMVCGSAIISYHQVVRDVPVDQYVAEVIAGKRFDNNLSKQLKMGFQATHVIPDYLPGDEDCAGYGVEIVWDNPDYVPPRRSIRPAAALYAQP